MKVYMIGLGKMGFNLAENMTDNGHTVIGYDVSDAARQKAQEAGLQLIDNLEDLEKDNSQKTIWVMLPAGKITNSVLKQLEGIADKGDVVIDGGNSDYHDSLDRAKEFSELGIHFMDIGTSGGTYGARHGASFMVGGDKEGYVVICDMLESIAAQDGLIYCGKSGSGHYLKVIHNAILHSEMEVLGEGFELLHASPFDYNLKDVAYNWNKSAVIRGWLMELMYQAFSKNIALSDVETSIHSSSAAIDAIKSACDLNVPVPMFDITLTMRQRTQGQDTFTARVINSLRKEVGGYRPKNA
ncbi:phosphogluconate dehydrogenase (NAD(+)-dependent, decarboxylating) [[Lactobacillus] timonensis]|uniref:phosphogluconate dehydrogenase (NAD(+)-dependent, decarboxylating) n=1 Tax=[Lactobacillus] timonensis TaxID=1970790 RepID=UPI000C865917|nr:decarboxylating 6-phosphogluconate dehydrogenase [[Lactobacillus] timonensis]